MRRPNRCSALTFVTVIFVLLVVNSVSAQEEPGDESIPRDTLVIGTKVAPPFSIKQADGSWYGISIDLWEEIALELAVPYRFEEYPLEELLELTARDSIDAAIAAITITSEREEILDFSHPYFQSGLGIAVQTESGPAWLAMLEGLFSWQFVSAIGGLTVLLFIVGLLIWIVERRRNPDQFGGSAIKGIGSGFWWSAVTMTTVGYGDKAPVTFVGRLIGLVWMFAAIIIISSFTAAIAASLTVSGLSDEVSGLSDLPDVRVGAVLSSTGSVFLDDRGIGHRSFETARDALKALADGRLDAVVYDAPVMQYMALSEFDGDIVVLKETFDTQYYGIALPRLSDMREPINRALLNHAHGASWNRTVQRYIGN